VLLAVWQRGESAVLRYQNHPVSLLGRSMVEMEESASRRNCAVVPYGLMSNGRR